MVLEKVVFCEGGFGGCGSFVGGSFGGGGRSSCYINVIDHSKHYLIDFELPSLFASLAVITLLLY